jgi:hypothetical protein
LGSGAEGTFLALILSVHMADELATRRLAIEWIALTVQSPDWTMPCPKDGSLTRSFRRIDEAGGRVLRVVHRPEGNDMLIVTAFLDRGARR